MFVIVSNDSRIFIVLSNNSKLNVAYSIKYVKKLRVKITKPVHIKFVYVFYSLTGTPMDKKIIYLITLIDMENHHNKYLKHQPSN